MKNDFLKTLWLLRFEKIKKTEEDSAWGYQEILDHCRVFCGKTDETVRLLERLVHDERMHAKLGDELIKICHRSHTEVGLL